MERGSIEQSFEKIKKLRILIFPEKKRNALGEAKRNIMKNKLDFNALYDVTKAHLYNIAYTNYSLYYIYI